MRTLLLDIEREIKWTTRAQCRLGSLDNPPTFGAIASKNRTKAFFALCAFIWASVDDPQQRFQSPEDLAEHLDTPEKQLKAIETFYLALEDTGLVKKKVGEQVNTLPTGSKTGPLASSNSDAQPPTSGS